MTLIADTLSVAEPSFAPFAGPRTKSRVRLTYSVVSGQTKYFCLRVQEFPGHVVERSGQVTGNSCPISSIGLSSSWLVKDFEII